MDKFKHGCKYIKQKNRTSAKRIQKKLQDLNVKAKKGERTIQDMRTDCHKLRGTGKTKEEVLENTGEGNIGDETSSSSKYRRNTVYATSLVSACF